MTTERTSLDLWFDPACPWSWITSRWALEVATVREVDVAFHVMSLPELGEVAARVCFAVQEQYPDKLGDFYTALGTRIHTGGQPNDRATREAALAEVGLPVGLAATGETDASDAALRAVRAEVTAMVGDEVGTPVIRVGGMALFGPVISPSPKGEEAGRLWDGFVNICAYPGFFELKRTRTVGPIFE